MIDNISAGEWNPQQWQRRGGLGEYDALGWGGFLNPTNVFHQMTQVAQKATNIVVSHAPKQMQNIVAKFSPTNILSHQAAFFKKTLPQNMLKEKMAFAIKHKLPGTSRFTQSGNAAMISTTYAQSSPTDSTYYDQSASSNYDYSAPPTDTLAPSSQAYVAPTDSAVSQAPGSQGLDFSQMYDGGGGYDSTDDTAALDVFQSDTTGDNTMQMGNIVSSIQRKSGPLAQSGMGDIWGDLMTFTSGIYGQKQAANIAQSQAVQAQAQAAQAAAQAAAVAASKQKGFAMSTPMMIGAAVAGVGLIWFLKRRKR